MSLVDNEEDLGDVLCLASRYGRLKEVRSVISRGIYVDFKNIYYETALCNACEGGHVEIVRFLLENKANPNLLSGLEINRQTTALIKACSNANFEIVQVLIENEADVRCKNYLGNTALHEACCNGSTAIVNLLIGKQASVNIQNINGKTPLHFACQHEVTDSGKLLLDNGADFNIRDKNGRVPLHSACKFGYTELIEVLINKKSNINVQDKEGITPLHDAFKEGRTESIQLLLYNKAMIDIRDNKGRTPLQDTCWYRRSDIVELLIRNKIDITDLNGRDKDGRTPLHYACIDEKLDVVDFLIKNKVDINVRDKNGRSPLHYACRLGSVELVELLMTEFIDINAKDKNNQTPLHYACINGKTSIVQLLLDNFADSNIKDKDRIKPIGYLKDKTEQKEFQARAKMFKGIPYEIRGRKAKRIFQQAISKGEVNVYHIRVMLVGHQGVGKTTITKALLQDTEQICDTSSTDGIDVYLGRCRIDLKRSKWEKMKKGALKKFPVRKKLQLVSYDELKRQNMVEEESWNTTPKQREYQTKLDKLTELQPERKSRRQTTESQSESRMKSSSFREPDEKSYVLSTSETKKDHNSKEKTSPNTASADIRKFSPKKKDLVPHKDDPLNELGQKICDVEIWDFGGQSVYYTTHQAFLSPRCIYPLVINGAKHLSDRVEDEELIPGDLTSKEIEEFVRFWIFSVVTYAKGRQHGFPKIIPILTHMDQIPEDKREERTEYIFQEIRRICDEYNIRDHLVFDSRLSFNALNPHDPAYELLREVILKEAQSYEEWGESMPATWVPLEHSLLAMKDAGYKILSFSDLEEINDGSELQPLEKEELLSFLQFQHLIAHILYFNDAHLRHNVIIHPQWLIDALWSIITAARFLQGNTMKERMLQNLSDRGVLEYSLLDKLWNNADYKVFFDNKHHLINTMVKMDLLAEPIEYDEAGSAVETKQFIVPAMVKKNISKDLIKEMTAEKYSASLLFTFAGKFLPKAIFNKLAATCINIWPLVYIDNKGILFSGFCSFRLDMNHIMCIRMLAYQILVTVTATNQSQSIPASLCDGIRRFLSSQLCRICLVHKDLDEEIEDETKKFHIEIPCCLEHLQCVQEYKQSVSDLPQKCEHHPEKEKVLNLNKWMNKNEFQEYEHDQSCTKSCPAFSDTYLTVKELDRLCRRLKGNPEYIKIVLDVENERLFDEEDQYDRGRIGKREFYFRILMKADAKKLKAESLRDAFYEADEGNAHIVCKVMRRRNVPFASELKDEFIFKIPSEEILDQLSSRIYPNDAFHLFIELGLDVIEIDRVRIKFPGDSLRQMQHMFKIWRRQADSRPTFRILEEAMIEVGINTT